MAVRLKKNCATVPSRFQHPAKACFLALFGVGLLPANHRSRERRRRGHSQLGAPSMCTRACFCQCAPTNDHAPPVVLAGQPARTVQV